MSFLGIVVHAGDFDNFNVVNQELNWIETNTLVNKVRLKLQYCSKYITYSIYIQHLISKNSFERMFIFYITGQHGFLSMALFTKLVVEFHVLSSLKKLATQ